MSWYVELFYLVSGVGRVGCQLVLGEEGLQIEVVVMWVVDIKACKQYLFAGIVVQDESHNMVQLLLHMQDTHLFREILYEKNRVARPRSLPTNSYFQTLRAAQANTHTSSPPLAQPA